jgi:hypothetical protein
MADGTTGFMLNLPNDVNKWLLEDAQRLGLSKNKYLPWLVGIIHQYRTGRLAPTLQARLLVVPDSGTNDYVVLREVCLLVPEREENLSPALEQALALAQDAYQRGGMRAVEQLFKTTGTHLFPLKQ